MKTGNLHDPIPSSSTEEFLEVLTEGEGKVKIERIVSSIEAPPSGLWCDQASTEWVAVLRGSAVLRFDNEEGPTVTLGVGDWIEIPPHSKHRVEGINSRVETVWLAVHWE